MCLIEVGPADMKVVIATPEEFLCVSTVSFHAVALQSTTEGEKSCRGVFMVQTCLQSSIRVHSHHLFTRTHLTAGVPEMCCFVLMCAQEEEQRLLVHSLLISATLGICHLHLNCPAYDYAFLLSYKPHSTLNWGLV